MIARLIQLFASTFDRQEREAILGDLAESGGTSIQDLRDVVGLWLRRQLTAWKSPGAWFALLGFVVPFGLLLGAISLWVADFSASIIAPGNRWGILDLVRFFTALSFDLGWLTPVMLASWSWSLGFAIGALSRRAAPLNALLLTVAFTAGEFSHSTLALRVRQDPHFHLAPFRIVFPLLLTVLCVLAPSLWAIREGSRFMELRPRLRVFAAASTVLNLAAMAAQICVWLAFPSAFGQPILWDDWPGVAFQILALWPLGYWLLRWRTPSEAHA
ncbi:MAG TPA: hypothetical protein VGL53_10305 [Bryobacteraceae bacterium]|jgi:hypothetical protein